MKIISFLNNFFKKTFYPKFLYLGKQVTLIKPYKFNNSKLCKLGNNVFINSDCWFSIDSNFNKSIVDIKNDVYIGRGFLLACCDEITINNNVLISDYVFIGNSIHNYTNNSLPISVQGLMSKGSITIGEGSWIGKGACILGGVTLGKNCVVGCNAVVTKSFPDFSVIAGVPAKEIKG